MPTERSMSKEEFEEIAEATLEQYGVNGYKVVLLDSPVDAIIETPELTQVGLSLEAYTGEDSIYFMWYKLKHATYRYQLDTIRHETAHALQETKHTNRNALQEGDMDEWKNLFSLFSISHENRDFHEGFYSERLIDYVFSNQTNKEARKNTILEEKKLLKSVESFFKSFEAFLDDIMSD